MSLLVEVVLCLTDGGQTVVYRSQQSSLRLSNACSVHVRTVTLKYHNTTLLSLGKNLQNQYGTTYKLSIFNIENSIWSSCSTYVLYCAALESAVLHWDLYVTSTWYLCRNKIRVRMTKLFPQKFKAPVKKNIFGAFILKKNMQVDIY